MKRRVLILLLIVLAAAVALFFYAHFQSAVGFRVVFFNIGQGDAALINFADGEKMLVDCGPDRKILNKLGKYLPFYDRTLDYLVISHPDGDHYGGCVDVLRRYRVKNIIENGVRKDGDSFWQAWEKYKSREGAQPVTVDRAKRQPIGGAVLEFLSPDPALSLQDKTKEGNNASVVFRLTRATTTILFTGDAELPLENALLEKYCASTTPCPALRAQYLKIGHHGSDSSSGDEFVAAVGAPVAIISVGKNTFGHPSLRVWRHLLRAGAEIWRTDEKGDIIIR